jgi:hypothetical protein
MRSVALSFAWEFCGRHRIAKVLVLAYLLLLVLLVNLLPTWVIGPATAAILSFPLWGVLPPLTALFAHGEQADILVRDSGYPRRLFTLPLRTAALAGWPLLLGGVTVAVYWLVLAGLVLRSSGVPVPVFWPAVFLVALLAWAQALVWFPFPLPFLRLIVAGLVLGGMTTAALLGVNYNVSPALLLGVSAALIPPGFGVAVLGVARARRGDAPVWNWPTFRSGAGFAPARQFGSASEAMFWMDWKRHGLGFPLMAGLFFVFPVSMWVLFGMDGEDVARSLLTSVGAVVMMSGGAGLVLGNCHPESLKTSPVPAFVAARPVTSAEILAVKFRLAARVTLATWVGAALVLAAVLPLSPGGEVLAGWTRRLIQTQGAKGWALLVLIVLGAPALSWKQIVNQLWIGLTGRQWLPVSMTLAWLFGLTGLALLGSWLYVHPETHEALRNAMPWAAGLAVVLKLAAGALVARALLRRRLVAPRTVIRFAAGWFAGAAVVFGLAFWLMPTGVGSPFAAGCAAILLGLPMVRLGLAPLALEWNRHR